MTAAGLSDLALNMEGVALAVLGEPNRALSSGTELRFGTNGSVSVDLGKGVWADHEAGEGGGVLDLIKREKGLTVADAFNWLRENGFELEDRREMPGHAQHEAPPLAPRDSKFGDVKREIEAAYDYVSIEGEVLFQAVRWVFKNPDGSFVMTKDGAKKKKTFTQRRPADGGAWANGLDAG